MAYSTDSFKNCLTFSIAFPRCENFDFSSVDIAAKTFVAPSARKTEDSGILGKIGAAVFSKISPSTSPRKNFVGSLGRAKARTEINFARRFSTPYILAIIYFYL